MRCSQLASIQLNWILSSLLYRFIHVASTRCLYYRINRYSFLALNFSSSKTKLEKVYRSIACYVVCRSRNALFYPVLSFLSFVLRCKVLHCTSLCSTPHTMYHAPLFHSFIVLCYTELCSAVKYAQLHFILHDNYHPIQMSMHRTVSGYGLINAEVYRT